MTMAKTLFLKAVLKRRQILLRSIALLSLDEKLDVEELKKVNAELKQIRTALAALDK